MGRARQHNYRYDEEIGEPRRPRHFKPCQIYGSGSTSDAIHVPICLELWSRARTIEPGIPIGTFSLIPAFLIHRFSDLSLFEDEVSHVGFEIRVDYRDGSQVEGSVGNHQDKDPSRDCENGAEHKSGDHALLDAGQALVSVMGEAK